AKLMQAPIAHQLPSWSRLRSCNSALQADLAAAGQADRTSLKRPNHNPQRIASELAA
ncbi:MAG: glycosyl transferase, partial [Cyanobacteriota bacterium]|nr:glycosyl transferase [Cyanobacteriota bacterium]